MVEQINIKLNTLTILTMLTIEYVNYVKSTTLST